MISIRGEHTYQFRGLSTDKKPVNNYIDNGSIFIEMDTSIIYTFDKKNKEWLVLDWNTAASQEEFDEFKEEVEEELEKIKDYSDVKDVVGTYADLVAYDTSKLNDNDVIEVLTDEENDNANTMYKWHKDFQEFELIGKLGPYYTKDESDAKYALKASEDTPEPDPTEPSTNQDLYVTLTQIIDGVPTSVKLTLEQLRERFIASDDHDNVSFEDAENGQFIYEEIDVSEIPADWKCMNGQSAWEEEYNNPNSTLRKYYAWSDEANKPYKEDLWNYVENRAANLSDARKVDGEYVLDENGNYIYDNCDRCWLGAINAPGASYPWAVVELDIPFEGTIRFNYKDENPVYPWGENNRVFTRGFAIASIPTELNKPELKINAEGESQEELLNGDLVITLLPKIEEEGN